MIQKWTGMYVRNGQEWTLMDRIQEWTEMTENITVMEF
jgi:hypothetical protein